jgi:hypothetical protein
MAAPIAYSKDFPLDAGIFNTSKVTIAGSTDANVVEAVLANDQFPDGNIQLGHISFTADTGKVALNPAAAGGATVSFDFPPRRKAAWASTANRPTPSVC